MSVWSFSETTVVKFWSRWFKNPALSTYPFLIGKDRTHSSTRPADNFLVGSFYLFDHPIAWLVACTCTVYASLLVSYKNRSLVTIIILNWQRTVPPFPSLQGGNLDTCFFAWLGPQLYVSYREVPVARGSTVSFLIDTPC